MTWSGAGWLWLLLVAAVVAVALAAGQRRRDADPARRRRPAGPARATGSRRARPGWVTLTLQPSRYGLICNLSGHYAAGMHAELDVR